MTQPTFVHLHLHTEYSLVDSTVRIPRLMEQVAADGMPAVAITDQNNLFGLVKFYKRALKAGVKPIVGADLRIAADGDKDPPYKLIVLCQDNHGYRNLSRLITRACMVWSAGISSAVMSPSLISSSRACLTLNTRSSCQLCGKSM